MIILRPMGKQVPTYLLKDGRWQVEYWNAKEQGYPAGVAWCYVCEMSQVLEYILVSDKERRAGVATRLVKACRKRWPRILLTSAISKGGSVLLKHLNLPPGTVICDHLFGGTPLSTELEHCISAT